MHPSHAPPPHHPHSQHAPPPHHYYPPQGPPHGHPGYHGHPSQHHHAPPHHPPPYPPHYGRGGGHAPPPPGSSHAGYPPRPPSPQSNVAALVERFVDNRRRRQQTIDDHLDEVEDALAQGDPVKFAFWSLDQDATFFEGQGPAPRMLEVLGREIGLTAEQMGQLNTHRPAIREDRDTLARCHELLRDAREHIHHHIHHSSMIMEQIRRILNPVQVAKFFVWVEKHQNSVKTLTTLWDGSANSAAAELDSSSADGEAASTSGAPPAERERGASRVEVPGDSQRRQHDEEQSGGNCTASRSTTEGGEESALDGSDGSTGISAEAMGIAEQLASTIGAADSGVADEGGAALSLAPDGVKTEAP